MVGVGVDRDRLVHAVGQDESRHAAGVVSADVSDAPDLVDEASVAGSLDAEGRSGGVDLEGDLGEVAGAVVEESGVAALYYAELAGREIVGVAVAVVGPLVLHAVDDHVVVTAARGAVIDLVGRHLRVAVDLNEHLRRHDGAKAVDLERRAGREGEIPRRVQRVVAEEVVTSVRERCAADERREVDREGAGEGAVHGDLAALVQHAVLVDVADDLGESRLIAGRHDDVGRSADPDGGSRSRRCREVDRGCRLGGVGHDDERDCRRRVGLDHQGSNNFLDGQLRDRLDRCRLLRGADLFGGRSRRVDLVGGCR